MIILTVYTIVESIHEPDMSRLQAQRVINREYPEEESEVGVITSACTCEERMYQVDNTHTHTHAYTHTHTQTHIHSCMHAWACTHTYTQGQITKYFIYICDTPARDITLGVLYGYKALLQVIALVFSFSIRKVKVKGLDDAKFIAASIYVSSIVLAVIIVSTYTLKDFLNVFPVVFCTGFLIGTTVILGLVFVPLVSETVAHACMHGVQKAKTST